jgi:DNA-binding MarR family transcriptional regulator
VYDEIERRERETWVATEPSWALWEVMRTSTDVSHVLARRLGLSYNEVRALELLSDSARGLGTVELANGLGMRSASATELVDRLETSGHVRRRPHETDRRRVVVELTEHGRDRVLAVLGPLLHRYDQVADGLSPEAAAAVAAYLRGVAAEQRAFCDFERPPAPRNPA